MIRLMVYIWIILIINACAGEADRRIRDEALSVAGEYIEGQLKAAQKKTEGNGAVIFSDENRKYILDPSALFTGFINEDDMKDAVITVFSSYNGYPEKTEHLFILSADGILSMEKAIESDMKILGVKDRLITAEIHTHPKTSPLYDCPECMEVVSFRYVAGELVKAE